MLGSLIFGFGWSFIYSSQLTINTKYCFCYLSSGLCSFSYVLRLINVIRILARIVIYPDIRDENALPIVIYGAGQQEKN